MGVGVTAEFENDGRRRIRGVRSRNDFCRVLYFFDGVHVTADGKACFYGAVIFEGINLVFQCFNIGDECGLSVGSGEREIGESD